MGAVPVTENEAAKVTLQFINILMTVGETAAETFLTGLAPEFLANPFMQYILDHGVEYIGGLLKTVLNKSAANLVIDIQTNGEKSAVLTAGIALQFALGGHDEAAIKKAHDNLSKAYGNLFHWDGLVTT